MNQLVLASPTALSTNSDTARIGAVSEMDMGGSCKISMLWNWNTIDACFISKSWRITSHGMFAGSCIGVILLVMSLEFFRRLSKGYDRHILHQFKQKIALGGGAIPTPQKSTRKHATTTTTTTTTTSPDSADDANSTNHRSTDTTASKIHFRPSPIQQSIRALLHMITFAIAYFVMLLAMYYNGYFIICIFIGAYLGAFVFSWESIGLEMGSSVTATAAMEDVTVCCG